MFFRRLIIISNTSSGEDVSSNRELSGTVVRSVDALWIPANGLFSW